VIRSRLVQLALAALLAGVGASVAHAQEPAPTTTTTPGGTVITQNPDGTTTVSPNAPVERQLPADLWSTRNATVDLNFPMDTSLMSLVKWFAELRRINFIISDVKALEAVKVTIISNDSVSPDAAWEAFLSALEVSGYSLSTTGKTAKIIKSADAGSKPIPIRSGAPAESDGYVTQLVQLDNTRVDDMVKVIQGMLSAESKVVSYPPTNTLIITDTAANIRKVYKLMKELDVASPKSTMEVYTLRFATAADVKALITELYGTAEEPKATASPTTPSRTSRASRRRTETPTTPTPSESVSAGEESKFIAKVVEDERTNALIVLANDDGHTAVKDIIAKVDVNVTPEGEIHVVYLKYAKAEEVQSVLSSLSQGGRGSSSSQTPAGRRGQQGRTAGGAAGARTPATPAGKATAGADGADGEEGGAIAAFDSGMRIAADENTNSLVIIADNDDFKVVESVIKQLDIERRQVFVDAVVMELSSEDAFNLGLAAHVPGQPAEGAAGFIGSQLGASSLGLTTDSLTGLAMGVFGDSVDIPTIDPISGLPTTIAVPAFGIVLNAIKSTGMTNIVSNPSLMTLDNEEAEISVGRKIPFPTTSGLNSLGSPVISFQREDVAITLHITPRVNSENYVTLELEVEVQEVEDSAQSAQVSAAGGGFITSNRKLQTVSMLRDNQTMVVGGLVGTTDSETESKVPVLGDIPVVGALFRSKVEKNRKTNLIIFLTPHIVDSPDDVLEIQRVKEAQRAEFLRRFYGKSRSEFFSELQNLLRYSLNFVDEPTMFRGPATLGQDMRLDGSELSPETREAIEDALDDSSGAPGSGAGEVPSGGGIQIDDPATGGGN
jgi:general secretion pathway protein D